MGFTPPTPEIDDRATATARVAIPVVVLAVDLKRFHLIVVEGTLSTSRYIQFDILTDKIEDGDPVLDTFRWGLTDDPVWFALKRLGRLGERGLGGAFEDVFDQKGWNTFGGS